jgi:hypothetical protein
MGLGLVDHHFSLLNTIKLTILGDVHHFTASFSSWGGQKLLAFTPGQETTDKSNIAAVLSTVVPGPRR